MKKQVRLTWFRHPNPGIHYAKHEGRVIMLSGFPHVNERAREFEVYDGRSRVGLIRGLREAKRYAERHLENLKG